MFTVPVMSSTASEFHRHSIRTVMATSTVLVAGWLTACGPASLTPIAEGFDISASRAPISENGEVGVLRADEIEVSDGTTSISFDVGALGRELTLGRRPVQLRNADVDEMVFIAEGPPGPGCIGPTRGVYRSAWTGGGVTTLLEGCPASSGDVIMGRDVAMSPGGTVAFSQLVNGQGAIYRGPSSGPVSVLRSGSGTFYNTRALDVNDAGLTPVAMEYFDGVAGGLMRGVPVFDMPEVIKPQTLFAIEKQGIGTHTEVSIDSAGTVALSIPHAVTLTLEGVTTMYEAGIYTGTPTLFNTLKSLTLFAGTSDGYCAFGDVEINDSGTVVFEARVDDGGDCGTSGANYDGIFRGPDSTADAVITFGASELGNHQYYDSINLGELNSSNQISLTTTYSEPLVMPVMVWRADL